MKTFITLFFSIVVTFSVRLYAQEPSKLDLGCSFGYGTQNAAPFNSAVYSHEVFFIKGQLNKELYSIQKLKLEFDFEPTYFLVNHQMLDPLYITPQRAPNYLEQRAHFLKPMTYSEFSLAVGLIIRYQFIDQFSVYIMGSVGPTLIQNETERLAKGFAFSDIAGLGFSNNWKKFSIDIRATVRHLSNANLIFPNSGHNSINLEAGVLFPIGKE